MRGLDRLTVLAAGLAIGAVLSLPALASAAHYVARMDPEPYVEMPLPGGGPVTVTTTSDFRGWGYSPYEIAITLPFEVSFYGQPYTLINVLGKGVVTFGTAYPSTEYSGNLGTRTIPGSGSPHNFVAVWWDKSVCNNGLGGPLKTQVVGTEPNRSFVIQWTHCRRYAGTGEFDAQLWLTEGSDEISVHYGPITGTWFAAMGVENIDGSDGTFGPSIAGTDCNPDCDVPDYPTDMKVTYSSGPDLSIQEVIGESVGYAGVSMHMEATVKNVGGKPADGFTGRFLVSASPRIDDSTQEIGVLTGTWSLQPGQSTQWELDAPLPPNLAPGTWFLLAAADPYGAVTETNKGNNVGASIPFTVGTRKPDLSVGEVGPPLTIVPGSEFDLKWTLQNLGNDPAKEVAYSVFISSDPMVSRSDRALLHGTVALLDDGTDLVLHDAVPMPEDVHPGTRYIGVIVDGEDEIVELRETNNSGVSEPILVAGGELEVVTQTLPSTTLNAQYCVRLDAKGGNGIYVWSVAADSTLPAGLSLQETPPDARLDGRPFSTSLCGQTWALGAFDFTVKVTSAGQTASRALHLDVSEESRPLTVITEDLPVAPFHGVFTTPLQAVGGLAPYTWTIAEGRFTSGLQLRSDGVIVGSAEEDAPESFTVEVRDSEGRTSRQALTMNVLSPDRLSCGTRRLPTHSLGEGYGETLHAAGGEGDYRWTTIETVRVSLAQGKAEETLAGPPPGLALSSSGQVTGKPTAAGSYQWWLTLADDHTSTECVVLVEIRADQGLTIATQHLPAATAGEPYRVTLESKGASNPVWLLVPGAELPGGLTLAKDGTIEGTPILDQLDGEGSRTYAFAVEVWDEANRYDEKGLSITVNATHPQAKVLGEAKTESGGCQAGLADPSLLALLAGAGLGVLRRRRR